MNCPSQLSPLARFNEELLKACLAQSEITSYAPALLQEDERIEGDSLRDKKRLQYLERIKPFLVTTYSGSNM